MLKSNHYILFCAMVCGTAIASSPSAKRIPNLSGNVTYTTNYLWRGITQTRDQFALQGGFDYESNVGLYVGTWASGVEFVGSGTVDRPAHQELEFYGGYRGKLGAHVDYDIGVIRYDYPGSNSDLNYDFNELAVSMGYQIGDLETRFSVNRSNDFWGGSGNATFVQASLGYQIDSNWSVAADLGRQTVSDNEAFGAEDYNVYGFSAEYAIDDYFSAMVGYTKTNLTGDAGDGKFYGGLSAAI